MFWARRSLHLFEVFMHELDRHCAFAHRRSDALHGPRAHVSGGEDTRTAGFKQERRARDAPRSRLCEGCSRPDKSFRVTLDLRGQPVRSRRGPNETKYRRSLDSLLLPALVICYLNRLRRCQTGRPGPHDQQIKNGLLQWSMNADFVR